MPRPPITPHENPPAPLRFISSMKMRAWNGSSSSREIAPPKKLSENGTRLQWLTSNWGLYNALGPGADQSTKETKVSELLEDLRGESLGLIPLMDERSDLSVMEDTDGIAETTMTVVVVRRVPALVPVGLTVGKRVTERSLIDRSAWVNNLQEHELQTQRVRWLSVQQPGQRQLDQAQQHHQCKAWDHIAS